MSPWWFCPISAMMKHGWFPPIIRPGHNSNFKGILVTGKDTKKTQMMYFLLQSVEQRLWIYVPKSRPEPLVCCTSRIRSHFRFKVPRNSLISFKIKAWTDAYLLLTNLFLILQNAHCCGQQNDFAVKTNKKNHTHRHKIVKKIFDHTHSYRMLFVKTKLEHTEL